MVRIDPDEGPQPGPFGPTCSWACSTPTPSTTWSWAAWPRSDGSRRATGDLDIVPAPTADNHRRLAGALRELDADGGVDAHLLDIGPTPRSSPAAPTGLATTAGVLDVLQQQVAVDYEHLRARRPPVWATSASAWPTSTTSSP